VFHSLSIAFNLPSDHHLDTTCHSIEMLARLQQTTVAVLGYWLIVAALLTLLAAAMPIDKVSQWLSSELSLSQD